MDHGAPDDADAQTTTPTTTTPPPPSFPDLRMHEIASILPLLVLSVVIGLAPVFLLDVIAPAAAAVVELVSR